MQKIGMTLASENVCCVSDAAASTVKEEPRQALQADTSCHFLLFHGHATHLFPSAPEDLMQEQKHSCSKDQRPRALWPLSLPHRTLGQLPETKQPFPPLPHWPEDTVHQEKAPGHLAMQQQQFNVPLVGEGKGSAGRGELFPAGSGDPSRRSLPHQFSAAPRQDTQPRPHRKGRDFQRRRSRSRIFCSREEGTLCTAKRMCRA